MHIMALSGIFKRAKCKRNDIKVSWVILGYYRIKFRFTNSKLYTIIPTKAKVTYLTQFKSVLSAVA